MPCASLARRAARYARGVMNFNASFSQDPNNRARTGESLFDYVHPDDAAWARAVFAEVVARRGSQRTAELRVRHADGATGFVRAAQVWGD